MKALFNIALVLSILNASKTYAQTIDTLVDVGEYQLHFNIIKGMGTPILFEAGGGEDGTTWKNILSPIAEITKTTLITYDRTGFGKSTFNATKHGILNGMIGLETGLKKLGYNDNIILVAHSQGGLYATLYASRHPTQVKAAILIDATTACFYEPIRLAETQHSIDAQKEALKESRPGLYYQGSDFSSNINYVRNIVFPKNIPVIDFVAENPPFSDKKEIEDWKKCHQEFAKMSPKFTGVIAYGTGHFIFKDNSSLIISSIAKAYAETLNNIQKSEIEKRLIEYAINSANETRRDEAAYRHSEDDLNSWGYTLLQNGEIPKALAVFKLNVLLNPSSWNVYDSYGEALLKSGNKEEAIKMYQKSIELNPKSENGKKILERLLKQ